jgi:hypothetical protein
VIGTGGRSILLGNVTDTTALTLLFIPTLYVLLEERFPRRLEASEGLSASPGEIA